MNEENTLLFDFFVLICILICKYTYFYFKKVMEKCKHKLYIHYQEKIARMLYPTVFSFFSILNSHWKEIKDTKINSDQKITPPTEIVTDSVFLHNFENNFNLLINPNLSESARKQIENNTILWLDIYFNESENPLTTIKPDQMYAKRKRDAMPQNLSQFLRTFYKEDYRASWKLSIKVFSVSKENNKICIEYDYVYTPK